MHHSKALYSEKLVYTSTGCRHHLATPGSREFGRDISIASRRMDVEGLPHQFL